jgi:hypothetical protein
MTKEDIIKGLNIFPSDVKDYSLRMISDSPTSMHEFHTVVFSDNTLYISCFPNDLIGTRIYKSGTIKAYNGNTPALLFTDIVTNRASRRNKSL